VRNQFPDAIQRLQTASALNPKQAEAHQLISVIYIQQMEYEKALPHLLAYLWLKPEDVTNGMTLAALYSKLGRNREAIAVFRGLLASHPEMAELHYFLGLLLSAPGQRDEALRELLQAVALNPDSPEFRKALDKVRAEAAPSPARPR